MPTLFFKGSPTHRYRKIINKNKVDMKHRNQMYIAMSIPKNLILFSLPSICTRSKTDGKFCISSLIDPYLFSLNKSTKMSGL